MEPAPSLLVRHHSVATRPAGTAWETHLPTQAVLNLLGASQPFMAHMCRPHLPVLLPPCSAAPPCCAAKELPGAAERLRLFPGKQDGDGVQAGLPGPSADHRGTYHTPCREGGGPTAIIAAAERLGSQPLLVWGSGQKWLTLRRSCAAFVGVACHGVPTGLNGARTQVTSSPQEACATRCSPAAACCTSRRSWTCCPAAPSRQVPLPYGSPGAAPHRHDS